MAEYFDLNSLDKPAYNVGSLNQGLIDLLGLGIEETNILFARAQIIYTKKHECDYDNYFEYKASTEATPDIISNPEYVGVHPDGRSIRYVGGGDKKILVAVRLKNCGDLWVKSVYPIKEDKLSMYLEAGQLVKII